MAARSPEAPCRVDDREQIQALWQTASEAFGQVDIWINNAGISNRKLPFAEARFEDIEQVITTNITGLVTCCENCPRRNDHAGIGSYL